jgi:hypothetical protein
MLTPDQRRVLAGLVDHLIPASGPMPSATAVGVHDGLIDRALGHRPDLVHPFTEALDAASGHDPQAELTALAEHRPELFQALTLLTAGAYFLSPIARDALGHTPPPRAVRDDVNDYVELLATVMDRGFDRR